MGVLSLSSEDGLQKGLSNKESEAPDIFLNKISILSPLGLGLAFLFEVCSEKTTKNKGFISWSR